MRCSDCGLIYDANLPGCPRCKFPRPAADVAAAQAEGIRQVNDAQKRLEGVFSRLEKLRRMGHAEVRS